MPDEAVGGCLMLLGRALLGMLRLLAHTFELCELFGWLGKWTIQAVTWGKSQRESEDPLCVLSGVLVFTTLFALGLWLT